MPRMKSPDPADVVLQFRLAAHDRDRLRALAFREQRTIGGQLRKLIIDYLEAVDERPTLKAIDGDGSRAA